MNNRMFLKVQNAMLPFTTVVLLVITGCAGLDVTAINTEADDNMARGFRYYESAPFLLVHTDNKGGLTSKVIYLPDLKKKRSLRPYNHLASNEATLTFDKGMLTGAKAVVDETVIPKAVVASLEKVATALITAANGEETAEDHLVPAPYLFRVTKNSSGEWILPGGQGKNPDDTISSIRVTAVRTGAEEREEEEKEERESFEVEIEVQQGDES